MTRGLLLVAAFVLPADAAPQLKPPKPVPRTEEGARIEALRVKYDQIRKSGDPDQRRQLAVDEAGARNLIKFLEDVSKGDRELEQKIVNNVGIASPQVKDLYDIAVYDRDRKKVEGGNRGGEPAPKQNRLRIHNSFNARPP